jgi:hypothetical protein
MRSDYSDVYCKACNACGRTKAAFVSHLRDESWAEDEAKRKAAVPS